MVGGDYCKQHDPTLQKQKEEAQRAELRAKDAAAEALECKAITLGEQLGVPATVYRAWDWHTKETRTRPYVVISFDDAQKLIARLNEINTMFKN